MKSIFYFLRWLLFVGWGAFMACTSDEDVAEQSASQLQLTLTVDVPERSSRVTENAEDFNEHKIHRLDCYLYPADRDVREGALLHLSQTFTGEQSVTRLESALSEEQVAQLFPEGTNHCKVYALANAGELLEDKADLPSVEALKSALLTDEGFMHSEVQPDFVMDSNGDEAVVFHRSEKRLSGMVQLARAATKITLTITSVKEVEEFDAEGNRILWTAHPADMQVYLNHGMRRTHVDAGRYPYQPQSEDDYFNTCNECAIGYEVASAELDNGMESRVWEQQQPFYSYPCRWDADEADAPYLILVVPWHKSTESEGSFYNCYYQIAIYPEGKELLRNHHYKINLSVSTLGSFTEEKPVRVMPSCVVLDWNTNTIDAALEHYRYLMVARDHIVLNNREEVTIPYFSSHPVKMKQVRCTRPDLSENIVTIENVSSRHYDLSLKNGNIVFHHSLNNHFEDPKFDFTPYTLTLRLCHEDKENYYQDVTIVQYPAIYAEADRNSDYHHDYDADNDNRHNGYAFVNGYYSDYYHYGLDEQDYFASLPGYVNRKASPNMYVFTITSVEGTGYVVGDPREKEISDIVDDHVMYNGSSYRSAWVEAPVLEEDGRVGGERRLRYYYATDNSRATRNMISPKFRIASAYAVMHTNEYPARTLDAMKKRCASYQEDGYPAGRWRLPTQAEFEFIMSQVDKGTMPELYLKGYAYWCAHGLGTPRGNGKIEMDYVTSSRNGSSTRCVYDEWYWENKLNNSQKRTFTWGDRKREAR